MRAFSWLRQKITLQIFHCPVLGAAVTHRIERLRCTVRDFISPLLSTPPRDNFDERILLFRR